ILLFLIAAGLTFYGLFFKMKFQMFPDIDTKFFYIHGKINRIKSLEFTSDKVKLLEEFILKKYDKKTLQSLVSYSGAKGYPENYSILFYLKPASLRDITSDQIIETMRKKMEEMNIFTNIYIEKDTGGPPTGRALVIDIVGNDNDKRKELTARIKDHLHELKGVHDIQSTDVDLKKEIKVYPGYEKIARLGVTAVGIAQIIKIAYEGLIVTDIQTPEEMIEYRIMLADEYRRKLSTLDRLKVLNNQHKLIPILQMVNMDETDAPTVILHYNGDRTTTISADVDAKIITPKEIYLKLKNDFKNFEIENPGFQLNFGGEAKESIKSLTSIYHAIMIAVAGIFLILILLFKSFSQPIIVLMTIPFGFIGVYLAFLAHGMILGVMALLGVTGLSGVVVNDSLVMVEHINMLKKKNPKKEPKQLIVNGAVTRLRPILVTTITTVAGLFPTAYGLSGKDYMLVPATMAISWGLIFATTLTLFLIPCLYHIEMDTRKFVNRSFQFIKKKLFT
ncbi:MAG: efflux RND transporter permease subunit, partial [Spirochaetes bacterium]|nr:efflux RND transporter permease subunit [Spirochaetota bacterium]